MKIFLALFLSSILFFSCQTESKKNQDQANFSAKKTPVNSETTVVKQWLIDAINTYFSQQNPDMKLITTKDYYEYKMDAMNVDLAHGLTPKQFHNKWKSKFDTSKAGVGSGFLISAQDWEEIKVIRCDRIATKNDSYLFDVELVDNAFGGNYPIKIKVQNNAGQFLIADVLE